MSRRLPSTIGRVIELATISDEPFMASRRAAGGSSDRPRTDTRPDAARWIARAIAVAATLVTVATVVGHGAQGRLAEPYTALAVAVNGLLGFAYLAGGLLLIERGRGGAIGPLLLTAGVIDALTGPLDLYLSRVFLDVAPEAMGWGGAAALAFSVSGYLATAAVVAAMLLFPDGRLRSRRWRWVLVLGCVATAGGVLSLALGSADFGPIYVMFRSPFFVRGVPGPQLEEVTSLTLQAFRLLAVVSLLVRWRDGGHVLRAQTTWVLAALALQAVGQLAVFVTRQSWDWTFAWLSLVNTAVALCLPLAMGIAIVRFRLFEIDRLVSRTIAYAAISAILGVTFVVASLIFAAIGASLGLATVFGGIQMGETVSVSMATLLVASLFGRVRRRVQRSVDRRFDRARYDGTNTIDGLSQRLRDDVDLDSVRDDVLGVVDNTLHPVRRTMWLRPPRDTRRTTP